MFLFCSNKVQLAVFKYIVCTNKLLVQSLVCTYKKVVKKLFPSHHFVLILIPKCTYTVFKNECSQFKNNVLSTRTMFSIQEQCSWILLSVYFLTLKIIHRAGVLVLQNNTFIKYNTYSTDTF